MPRQQQVDDAIRRAFEGRNPSGKVKVAIDGHSLTLYHYHHTLLRWDLQRQVPTFQWFEKPTDKRILAAALEALAADGRRLWGARGGSSVLQGGAPQQQRQQSLSSLGVGHAAIASEERGVALRSSSGSHGTVTVLCGRSSSEGGSRFLALACFPVANRASAEAGLSLLRSRPELSGATHRIGSFRASGDGSEHHDDDGEARAGGVLLAAMRAARAAGCAVVVARWYGGRNIGKARFRHIRERASALLEAAAAHRALLMGEGRDPPPFSGTGGGKVGHRLSNAGVQAPLRHGPVGRSPPSEATSRGNGRGKDTGQRLGDAAGLRATPGCEAPRAQDTLGEESAEARRALAAAAAEARLRKQQGPEEQVRRLGCASGGPVSEEAAAESSKRQRLMCSLPQTLAPCSWACPACTLINGALAEQCGACGGQRPPAAGEKRPGRSSQQPGQHEVEVIDLAGSSDSEM